MVFGKRSTLATFCQRLPAKFPISRHAATTDVAKYKFLVKWRQQQDSMLILLAPHFIYSSFLCVCLAVRPVSTRPFILSLSVQVTAIPFKLFRWKKKFKRAVKSRQSCPFHSERGEMRQNGLLLSILLLLLLVFFWLVCVKKGNCDLGATYSSRSCFRDEDSQSVFTTEDTEERSGCTSAPHTHTSDRMCFDHREYLKSCV